MSAHRQVRTNRMTSAVRNTLDAAHENANARCRDDPLRVRLSGVFPRGRGSNGLTGCHRASMVVVEFRYLHAVHRASQFFHAGVHDPVSGLGGNRGRIVAGHHTDHRYPAPLGCAQRSDAALPFRYRHGYFLRRQISAGLLSIFRVRGSALIDTSSIGAKRQQSMNTLTRFSAPSRSLCSFILDLGPPSNGEKRRDQRTIYEAELEWGQFMRSRLKQPPFRVAYKAAWFSVDGCCPPSMQQLHFGNAGFHEGRTIKGR